MKFTLKRLIFIIILTSITKISLSHEFWIDPKNYHLSNNEKAMANIFIGENFEGSPIPFTKEYFKIAFLYAEDKRLKIKGRLGDIPALNIKKRFNGFFRILFFFRVVSFLGLFDYPMNSKASTE